MSDTTSIPTYKLYGEAREWPTPELLHHESIAERSLIHNWVIRPHRHNDLFQLLYIRRGGARIMLDGREEEAVLPCLLVMPPMCVHGFEFSEDIDGHVVTLPDFAMERFFNAATGLRNHFENPHILASLPAADVDYLDAVFEQMREEFLSSRPARLLALEASLGLILVRTVRLLAGDDINIDAVTDISVRHLRKFHELIAGNYRRGWSVEDYASSLGITATRLNSICRRHANRTALQLVHDRVILEAKRNLVYTAMTISEIAYSLGFADPAYFSRFFTRMTGLSPSAFRNNRGSGGRRHKPAQ